MRRLRDFSIKGKLMAVTLLTSGIGLLVFGGTLLVYDLAVVRRTVQDNLVVLAEVVANNSAAALILDDDATAQTVLGALNAHPHIVGAALYTPDGRLFASFTRDTNGVPDIAGRDGWQTMGDHLMLFRPVMREGRRIGTIYLDRSLGERTDQIRLYIIVMVVVLGGALLVVMILSVNLHRLISLPLLTLANTARAVSERKDYSVRAEKFSGDELGMLTDTFNQMLTAIQARDNTLHQAYDTMLKEIGERRRAEEALRLDESRLEALVKLNQMMSATVDDLTRFALDEGVRLTRSQIGYLAFLNEDETVLTMHAWSKTAMEQCAIPDKPLVYQVAETGLWGEAVRQRRPVITNDYAAPSPLKKGLPAGHVTMQRHMNVPVFEGERIVAVAGVGNKTEPYDDADVRQLTLLMQAMWRLIQRHRADEELRRHRDHLEELVTERTAALKTANDQLTREIAERRRAEETAHQARDRAQNYLDVAGVMIVVINPDQTIRLINREGCRLLGYSEAEILGQNWFTHFLPPAGREPTINVFEKLMAGEAQLAEFYENPVQTKTGKHRLIAWHNILLRDAHGQIEGVLSSGEDVTDQRRAEKRLKETAAALARSNQELEEFAYVASHDLREPLRMIASYVQLLQRRYENQLDDDARQYIAFAVDGAHRMQQLIDDLLQYARIETRAKPFAPIDCQRILDTVRHNLGLAIEETGAAIIVENPLPIVPGDDTQLTQLFQNLLSNALKFRRPDAPPQVHISAQRHDNDWLFRVRDNGIGIAPDYHDRIFVIFQRLHTRDQYPGTGIGLALCKKIVERHGGRIWVESAPNHGATFHFTLPTKETTAP